jgi:hypothetical protein
LGTWNRKMVLKTMLSTTIINIGCSMVQTKPMVDLL